MKINALWNGISWLAAVYEVDEVYKVDEVDNVEWDGINFINLINPYQPLISLP
ncbi:MAG: hypothetical protein ABIO24_03510 [Saprospiraceae bacterium]